MEVAVVGGGVTGLFAARYLEEAGLDVTIYERGPLGAGSVHAAGILESSNYYRINVASYLRRALRYWRNGSSHFGRIDGRWLRSYIFNFGSTPTTEDWAHLNEMGQFSLSQYKALADEHNDIGFSLGGLTEYYHDKRAFGDAVNNAKGREGSTRLEVSSWGGGAGKIHYADMGWLDTDLLVKRMASELSKTRVVRAEVKRAGTDGTVTVGGKSRPYDAVIIASGVSCRRLGIPITSVKGYGWHTKTSRSVDGAEIYADRGIAAVPLSSSVKVTGGWDFDLTADIGHSGQVLARATSILGITDVLDFSMGHRPCSPDGLPVVGMKGKLFVASGGFRLGWSYAPGIAEEVTGLVIGKKKPDKFLSRFLHGMKAGNIGGAFQQWSKTAA